MQIRNEWMVDQATRMAALWDGSGGGTGYSIQSAGRLITSGKTGRLSAS
jgi:hypothetical protein